MISRLLNKFFIVLVLFFIVRGVTYPETHFSGFTGIKGDFFSEEGKSTFTPNLTIDAYFAGQLDFGKNLFVRGELAVATGDIIDEDLFEGTYSKFALNELSVTFRKSIYKTANYFSLFMGTYEPIGSDVFLQRHFGIEPISSNLMDNWLGLNGTYVFPFFGMGGSYVLKMESVPVAVGLYVYTNKKNPDDVNQLSFDLRGATVWPYLTVDFAAGVGLPIETKNKNGDDVLLLIDTVYLHLGWNILVGNRYTATAFLFQGGFSSLPLHSADGGNELEARDVYVILEPRFRFSKFNLNVSLYSIPETNLEKMLVLEDTLGLNINMFTDKISIKNKNMMFGFHALLSFTDLNFMDFGKIIDAFKDEEYTIKIAPYVGLPVMSGELKTMFQVNISNLIKGKGAEWMKLSVGFKKQL